MDASDLNGGKAETARVDFNLECMFTAETPVKVIADNDKPGDKNLNGDLKSILNKKNASPSVKRKSRKLKANSNNSVATGKLSPTAMQLNKRKASENVDVSSSETEEFNGFEIEEIQNLESGYTVLKKLIAEAESGIFSSSKRRKVSPLKTIKNTYNDVRDNNENSTDSDDEKVTSELGSNNNDPEESLLKVDKSENNSVVHSSKLRKNRLSRGVSPGNAIRQKVTVDISNPAYRVPFDYGWKRELVYRAGSSENQTKRMADIYYYTPEGKKVRSYREVTEFLTTSEITIDNFTFFKEPLGVNDPCKEIIRDAKKPRDQLGNKMFTKVTKKGNDILLTKKTIPKKGEKFASSPLSMRTASKSAKTASALKIKLPTKKGITKKDCKSPQLTLSDNELTTPTEWNSNTTRKNFDEKSPSTKSKKLNKTKVQEPCSIRCSAGMGLIPSLHCCVCLCLYHPECAGYMQVRGSYEFVCQNCKIESDESSRNETNHIFSPPPLIPISILNASTSSSKHQSVFLPQLQPIPKLENIALQNTSRTKTNKSVNYNSLRNSEKKFTNAIRSHSEKVFLDQYDECFAQSITTLGGQKYIVIPKNNTTGPKSTTNTTSNKIKENSPVLRGTDDILHIKTSDFYMGNELNKSTKIVTESAMDLKKNEQIIEATISDNIDLSLHERFQCNDLLPPYSISIAVNSGISKISQHNSTETVSNHQDLTVISYRSTKKTRKKQTLVESDHRQHFMVSICAGYHALSRIFQYLKVQELLRAARVCHMWRDLAAHPSLWKTVRMKNSQVTDWDGLADTLKCRGTQHLDLRKMLIAGEADNVWKKFVTIIPKVSSLIKLELCRCPAIVVEEVMKNCPQLEVLSAMSIKCDSFNIESISNLHGCKELRLKAVSGMLLRGDLLPLSKLSKITHLSLTSIKDLGKKKVDVLQVLHSLQTLELGECSDFPEKFGTAVLIKLQNLERLRLEKGQGSCCTFDILEGISKLDNLSQLELVNFDVKSGFDKYLADCKNIKRLLIIPTYVSQSATSNNMILAGVTELSNNLTHFVWGVTQELLRVTELFVDQCNQMSKQITGDSIPVLKPVPCLKLIEDILGDKMNQKDPKQQTNLNNPQVEILPLPHLQKLLLTALPKTRVKILKIPFHATWRQSISDSTSQ
ncbi:uncharacterized protein LOC131668335 isoform X1 [Phymastichus coffea]|uniref:uncharacterized protein LOC131668335 isoform X1 n=1 Tax=Phymastichus coffea TaxID=108790 RepID=UPI00273B3B1F|nr:uncharacterized protein LOC131668335 isoform X1 [Phymastichus coffea]XP_058798411.1 uncharacterized protein LOC131668335 isoform X1 [Phymastichus coffea]XP_058798420.1 uncharacterized protein LOC131668335 isoform X1 [Phymastichus coffea]XP_058798427.1 uncharacterized protein LOC131668335 isoform X1 [Phymastichus coffea]